MKKPETRNYKLKTNKNGFTIVELLATLLILFGVIQIFTSVTEDVNSSALVKDNLVAANLVQEGIEVVRNIRDKDWFLGGGFGSSLPDGTWLVQWNSSALAAVGANPPLKKDNSGIFSYDSGTDTVFRRTITVSTISAQEKKIVSTVTWNFRGSAKAISAEDHLFNWFK